ncbi:MAP/microtubule affinity-regulating kinase 4-like isoform X1 [Astatotilapia calliptera]|nr:MAP/microtubule affinity-regulating kinase 4-like isoform X1 [Astatotilapia calliptera]
MAKRKASPEKKTPVKRGRVTEQAAPSTSSDTHQVKAVKRKAQQDGAGTTSAPKKIKLAEPTNGDREQASSSVDTGKDSKSRMAKRKASPEKKTPVKRRRVTEQAAPSTSSDTHQVKAVKRKAQQDGAGTTSAPKKIKLAEPTSEDREQASSSVDTGKDSKSRMAKRKASPEKKTPVKRRRVTEQAAPSTSSDTHQVKAVKRKAQQDGAGTTSAPKKIKLAEPTSEDREQASSSVDTGKDCSQNTKGCTKNGRNKSAGDSKESPKKKKKDKTKNVVQNPAADQQREYQARYVQEHHLGNGGCGAVFAGYRITDHFPVAIKHVPKNRIPIKVTDENGKEVSVEVAILLKLAAEADGSVGTSAPVSLLDWFDFGTELILVQERPVPAVDLFEYIRENGGCLPEGKAKVILKQLVDAAKDLEEKDIFHRDIKSDNILIETGSDVPRVRIIDFGLSCFATEQSQFCFFYGTPIHSPPECYWGKKYRPGPTTVWQMGVVLYEALHVGDFNIMTFIENKLKFNEHLSPHCRNFLDACLTDVPEKRPTLGDLQRHPWLR